MQKLAPVILLLLIPMLAACTRNEEPVAPFIAEVPSWEFVFVDGRPLARTFRRQIADVAYLGGGQFVVAYIGGVNPDSSGKHPKGELRYVRFDAASDRRSARILVAPTATWIRAMTGGPLIDGTCDPLVRLFSTPIEPVRELPDYGLPNYVNFISYAALEADTSRVALVRYNSCGKSFETRTVEVGIGESPSIAAGFNPAYSDEVKLLVVYGRANRLYGQFLDVTGNPIEAEFLIDERGEGYTYVSTDVIWNAVGGAFIVGFMPRFPSSVDGASDLCTVNNVRISWDGDVAEPVKHGRCDVGSGGHHTSVAYDNRGGSNPDGIYAWWFERGDNLGKGIWLMDADGLPTNQRADINSNAITQPVAPIRELGGLAPMDAIDAAYVSTASNTQGGPSGVRLEGYAFGADGSSSWIDTVIDMDSFAVAIGTMQGESVVVWRCDFLSACDPVPGWGITLIQHDKKPSPTDN